MVENALEYRPIVLEQIQETEIKSDRELYESRKSDEKSAAVHKKTTLCCTNKQERNPHEGIHAGCVFRQHTQQRLSYGMNTADHPFYRYTTIPV